ncbi:MAG: ATP-binding protein, partial [Ktedonobacterales bacterium]
ALDTNAKLQGAKVAIEKLGALAAEAHTNDEIAHVFQAFMAAQNDIEHVYWLDPFGGIVVSVKASPNQSDGIGVRDDIGVPVEFSPPNIVQQALDPTATEPVFEVGIAQETAGAAGVIIANPVKDSPGPHGKLLGIVAMSLSLEELSAPLTALGRHPWVSIIDASGELIATPLLTPQDRARILENVLGQLPGALQALNGQANSQIGSGLECQDCLFSSVPVPDAGWAVVVQRPSSEALDIVTQFHLWLLATAVIFAIGVLVFWLMLLNRVIRPLHTLDIQHRALPIPTQSTAMSVPRLVEREDEVGSLARSLERLERDVHAQLGELQTLLETSNAVVNSLDPKEVGRTIITEVRRLVDAQAAAVLVPDEQGILRVLVSEGRDSSYADAVHIQPDELAFPAARALYDGRPVQMVADGTMEFPPISYDEGFRAVLAVPIISRHAGAVVLLVHRTEPQPFLKNDLDLLLTFANYATLAWEHAVLYERSDERLREVAAENERLYRLTHDEKQRLAAIMGSMSDGLVLAGADGRVLYANPGAAILSGLTGEALATGTIASVHQALRAATEDPDAYDHARQRAETGEQPEWTIEIDSGAMRKAVALRLFDVRDTAERNIGRGLLLRDVTREREADEFKTTLLAAVGHELRTPLAAIKGHASTLLQDDVVWSPEEQRRSLHTISAEVDRLTGLVRDLLDLSRQQMGMLPLHRDAWRLDDLLSGALQRLGQPPPELAADLPPSLPLVQVDRARMEVVLRNLLANALAYGGESVCVTATSVGNIVEVIIGDDGPGIEPDELPHLFERFYRARLGKQLHAQGTGLGLAICKAFVEAHGGTITAQSGPDGTTMRFTLPAAPPRHTPKVEALTHSQL